MEWQHKKKGDVHSSPFFIAPKSLSLLNNQPAAFMKALVIEEGLDYLSCKTQQITGEQHKILLIPTVEKRQYITMRIPAHQVFNLLLFKKDSLSDVKIGCDRYTDCKLLSTKEGFLIEGKRDRFYNLSEHALYRADVVTNYLNDEGDE